MLKQGCIFVPYKTFSETGCHRWTPMDLNIGETRIWLSFRAKFATLTYGSISRSAYEKTSRWPLQAKALRYHDSDDRIPTNTWLTILYYVTYSADMYGYTYIYIYIYTMRSKTIEQLVVVFFIACFLSVGVRVERGWLILCMGTISYTTKTPFGECSGNQLKKWPKNWGWSITFTPLKTNIAPKNGGFQ